MKEQKGQILISRGSWALRWYESVSDPTGAKRKVRRFKVLTPVLPEHRRNLKRVPVDIQAMAKDILEPINSGTAQSIRGTIGDLLEMFLQYRTFKPSTLKGYRQVWGRYLSNRVAEKMVASFKRVDAYMLWREIHEANPHLSKSTMRHVRFLVSGLFEFAKNIGAYTGENPAKADLPEGLTGRGETGAYTVEDVSRMLTLFSGSSLTQAIIALAFASGGRKGELQGLRWEDMERTKTGAVIRIRRAVWNGKVITPKTESSADDIHIEHVVLDYIEAYRQSVGGVTDGYMFGYSHDHPINLHSFARWQVRPVLEGCVHCGKKKKAHKASADHQYQRNDLLPRWLGWNAFRRGNATHLARQYRGDGTKAASLMLRHSDTSVTKDHYIKVTRQERRASDARKTVEIAEQRQMAAAVLGAGLKQASVN